MNAVSDSLKEAIQRAINAGPLAELVLEVQVEPGCDEENEEFLRVVLSMSLPQKNVDAQLEALLVRIEEAVAVIDSRYPSVRILDAA